MIARIWRGAVRAPDADEYTAYIRDTGIAEYLQTPGNRGAWMLRRDDGDRTSSSPTRSGTRWARSGASRATTSRPPSTTPRTSAS